MLKIAFNAAPLTASSLGQNAGAASRTAASRMQLDQASRLLMNSVHQNLRVPRGFPGSGAGASRSIVTDTTLNTLKKKIPDKVSFKESPPYQPHGRCEGQATQILMEIQKSRGSEPPVKQQAKGTVAELLAWWRKILTGDFKTVPLANAGDFLKTHKSKGPFGLRGPGLGEAYHDHALAVFAAIEIKTKSGPKTVLGVLDCNDLGTDPQTKASWETATKAGKSHVSKLSHEEANQNGAEARRIRFIDADALAAHMTEYWKHNVALEIMHPGPSLTSTLPNHPTISYAKDGIRGLSPGEEKELRTLLEDIYDTEVEKFENQDYSWMAHRRNLAGNA
jgi:hypothetical protein